MWLSICRTELIDVGSLPPKAFLLCNVLESTPVGRVYATVERKGQPSKWITLGACVVLKNHYR